MSENKEEEKLKDQVMDPIASSRTITPSYLTKEEKEELYESIVARYGTLLQEDVRFFFFLSFFYQFVFSFFFFLFFS